MITLDDRVGHSPGETRSVKAERMVTDLRRMGVPVRLGRLPFGDVRFRGWGPLGPIVIGIELKTVTGLLGDMVTGRFAGGQIGGMQQAYQYRYLFVEGPVRRGMDGMLEVPRNSTGLWWSPSPRIMYVDYLKFIDDVDLRGGFHVRHTWNRMDTLSHIVAEFQGFQKQWHEHRGLKHFNEAHMGVVQMADPSLTRLWARDLWKVGWDKSEAMERAFKTPLALAQATVAEFRAVVGIGATIAERAWRDIRGLK